MCKDIIGNGKKDIDFTIWTLYTNNEEYKVEVFNAASNDRGVLVGYIKDSTHTIDIYTNYTMTTPIMGSHLFTVTLERIDKNTLKFSTPEYK